MDGNGFSETLRLLHAGFNSLVIVLFYVQGILGFKLRGARRRGERPPLGALKAHRKAGPVLAILGISGFFAGLAVVTLTSRRYLDNPYHLAVGLLLSILIVSTLVVSKRIRGPESPARKTHLALGVIILFLYIIQAFLGLGALF